MGAQNAQPDLFLWRFDAVREPVRTSSGTGSNHGSEAGSDHRFGAEKPAEPVIGETGEISGILNDFAGSNRSDEFPNDFAGSRGTPLGGRTTEPINPVRDPYRGSSANAPPPCEVTGLTEGSEEPNRSPNQSNRSTGGVIQPPVAPTLRPYQVGAVEGVMAERAKGVTRTLLVLPTGAGKTVCFAEVIRLILAMVPGARALVLAHRTELLKQAQRKLLDVGLTAGIEKAEQRAGRAQVVVASVQTLKGARLEALRPSDFAVIVVDEAHHAAATSYKHVFAHFVGVFVLGVSATPDRGDGKALGEVFASVAYRYELRAAIRDGWLAPIRCRRVLVQGLDLSSVRSRAGDLAQDELAAIMNAEGVVHGIAGPLFEQVVDRKTIVFAVDVEGAHAIAAILNRHRIGCARAIDGSADEITRTLTLEAFARGEFQFLVNCALFTEGFDEPSVRCVAICRPTKSRALYTQMVGRGTRLYPGKPNCLLLDFVGNSGRHKLIGPIDALAPGEVDEDVYGEANEMLTAEGDVDQALLDAQESLLKKREAAATTVRAKYFSEDVDPFLGEQLPLIKPFAGMDEPAHPEHVVAIRNAYPDAMHKRLPANLTRGDAEQILAAIGRRKHLGLATVKQSAVLRKFGVNVQRLTFDDANKLMGVLRQRGFDAAPLHAEMRRLEAIAKRSWQ